MTSVDKGADMSGRKLKDYFPMIRTREQILQDIESDIVLKAKFESFTRRQEEGISGFLHRRKRCQNII